MKRTHSHGDKAYNPETLALGYAYDPDLFLGSVKPPVFLTSTFEFRTAEEGKRFFELAYGLRAPEEGEEDGLIYSRLNNPNLQILEKRIAAWDHAELGAAFASGMAAISTTILALLRAGDVLLATKPLYGGTHFLLENVLPGFSVETRLVPAGDGALQALRQTAEAVGPERVRMLYVETPANPSNVHTDISAVSDLARDLQAAHGGEVATVVDNTFLGPVFQRPADLGADLTIYSATKFIGGHSDLIAGIVTGKREPMQRIRQLRTFLGTVTTPFNGWLILRSLETVSVRMRRQAKNARALAGMLAAHPRVERVRYPGLLEPGDPQHELWSRQCTGAGSLISFEVAGGEKAAFEVLNRLEVFRLAVSLGGSESLVEHPMTMTHADVPPANLEECGVTPGMIRLSVGLEHLSDLKRDLTKALEDKPAG